MNDAVWIVIPCSTYRRSTIDRSSVPTLVRSVRWKLRISEDISIFVIIDIDKYIFIFWERCQQKVTRFGISSWSRLESRSWNVMLMIRTISLIEIWGAVFRVRNTGFVWILCNIIAILFPCILLGALQHWCRAMEYFSDRQNVVASQPWRNLRHPS